MTDGNKDGGRGNARSDRVKHRRGALTYIVTSASCVRAPRADGKLSCKNVRARASVRVRVYVRVSGFRRVSARARDRVRERAAFLTRVRRTKYVRGSSGSMSEGADSVTQTCGDTTLTTTITASERRDATTGTATPSPPPLPLPLPPQPPQPTTTTTYTGRRPRFGTGGPPSSPYVWIDGRQLRSALSWTNKWPTRPPGAVPLRVSFPANDNHLVTGYLEPANPWRHGECYYRIISFADIHPGYTSFTWSSIRSSIIDRYLFRVYLGVHRTLTLRFNDMMSLLHRQSRLSSSLWLAICC